MTKWKISIEPRGKKQNKIKKGGSEEKKNSKRHWYNIDMIWDLHEIGCYDWNDWSDWCDLYESEMNDWLIN